MSPKITTVDENQNIISEMKYRIRYGRDKKGQPKNTLVTTQVGDLIYFGIARCKTKVDRAKKDLGKQIALGRLDSAFKWDTTHKDWKLEGSLYGCINIEDVKKLLEYFKNIELRYTNGET